MHIKAVQYTTVPLLFPLTNLENSPFWRCKISMSVRNTVKLISKQKDIVHYLQATLSISQYN